MSDNCKQCSEEMFGKDFKELVVPVGLPGFALNGRYAQICEGCGWTVTDENGVCLHCKADKNRIVRLEVELKAAREQVESLKYLQNISKKQYDKALAEIERKDRALRYVNEKTAPSNNVNIMPFWMHSIEKIREVIREAMHPKGE